MAEIEVWFPDFCRLRRFGFLRPKKCLVAILSRGFRRYQTSRFAQERVPNLRSCHEKIPNARFRQYFPAARYQTSDPASAAPRAIPNL